MSGPRKPFYDKFVRQLQNPEVRRVIRNKEGSRLFDDLPDQFKDKFNWLFVNFETDKLTLISLLKNIKDIKDDPDRGPCFVRGADSFAIECFAKEIIRQGCDELLNDKNEVERKILRLMSKTTNTLSGRDIICAYFATISQHLLVEISKSPDYRLLNPDVFIALTIYLSKYTEWVDEVINRNAPFTFINQHEPEIIPASNRSISTSLAIGGILFFGSLASAYLFPSSNQETSSENKDKKYPDYY